MNNATILVVDDNATNLKLVTEVLRSEGYNIVEAIDAESALAAIENGVPDLILMDIALPGMDGLTLTSKLKAEARTKDVSIIALTAFAMKGDDLKAKEAGCDGYITKPIDIRNFATSVHEFAEMALARRREGELSE